MYDPYILTRSGKRFFFLHEHNEYNIEDIADALSKTCRFAGHTSQFYSVAQHSVMCSWHVKDEFKLEALLHDAIEAYMGDISTPLKRLLPKYKELESMHHKAMARQFGIPEEISQEVHQVDLVMLATEKRDFMPVVDDDWPILDGIVPLSSKIYVWDSEHSAKVFYNQFNLLMKDRK